MGFNFKEKMTEEKLKDKYYRKLKLLNETIWERKATQKKINSWLDNFRDEERLHSLYLLTQFIYFSEYQIENLLVSLYRDHYKYSIIKDIRKANNDSLDEQLINTEFKASESRTRFVSLGNPSESSATLMGCFRKVNDIPVGLFISEGDISAGLGPVDKFVFIDDLCGSGNQAIEYSDVIIPKIKAFYPHCKVVYLMLISTKHGKLNIKENSNFDYVDSILELDESYKCFSDSSRVFTNKDDEIDIDKIQEFCGEYGKELMYSLINEAQPDYTNEECTQVAEHSKFGYSDGQLLLGFHHNTPDNTLPIFWYNKNSIPWTPIFKRFNKVY